MRTLEAEHAIAHHRFPPPHELTIDRVHEDIDTLFHQYRNLITSNEESALMIELENHYQAYLEVQTEIFNSDFAGYDEQTYLMHSSFEIYHSLMETLTSLVNLNEEIALKADDYGHLVYTEIKNAATFIIVSAGTTLLLLGYLLTRELIQTRNSLRKRVQRALKNNDFHCVYQPLVDLKSGHTAGFEVLSRLRDEHGAITPDVFIPIISEQKRTWSFTQSMLERALDELAHYPVTNDFKLSVNIFPCDINDGSVKRILDIPGIERFKGVIALEITESEVLDYDAAKEHLNLLSTHGFQIAIDDFGTGYSNFAELEVIAADYLKIDRSFVNDMESKSIKSVLISHILPIAKELNMKVIAEGVENSKQYALLAEMGVDYGQGWTFGKPLPMTEYLSSIETTPDILQPA